MNTTQIEKVEELTGQLESVLSEICLTKDLQELSNGEMEVTNPSVEKAMEAYRRVQTLGFALLDRLRDHTQKLNTIVEQFMAL